MKDKAFIDINIYNLYKSFVCESRFHAVWTLVPSYKGLILFMSTNVSPN